MRLPEDAIISSPSLMNSLLTARLSRGKSKNSCMTQYMVLSPYKRKSSKMPSAWFQSAVDGFNVCVFAYGQTGSGKTFTMQGEPGNLGITPRAINELFVLLEQLPGHLSFKVSCYMVELYMDNLIDLLKPRTEKAVSKSLSIKKDTRGMVYIPDATKYAVYS